MTKINLANREYSSFSGFETLKDNQHHLSNSEYIKHKLHENKIDEFFWTDIETPHNRTSFIALLGATLGTAIPVFISGKKHNPGLKLFPLKDSLKKISKIIDINYGIREILATGVGGAVGGLIGGLLDRKEPNKLDKIQEANFQIMNIAFPALLVGTATKICEKTKKLNNTKAKLLFSGLGMLVGVKSAVALSNKVDNKLFDKYNVEPDRKFKKKDFIVHIDDIFGALILAKIPLAEKIHINKILPLIYVWSGFHIGEK